MDVDQYTDIQANGEINRLINRQIKLFHLNEVYSQRNRSVIVMDYYLIFEATQCIYKY